MSIKLPFVFSQQDSRWANSLLGFNTNSVYNFYNYACLITCLAMLSKYYGKDENPQTINDKLKTVNGFVAGGGDYIYGGIIKLFGDIKERVTITPNALTDAQIGEIKTALDAGYPVMVQLDYNPRTVDLDSHFVLLVDYDPADENNFTIADPIGGKLQSIKAYLGWFRPSVRKTIEKYIIYTGQVPAVTADMISISKEHYELYTRNHDEWHKIVHYLLPENDPNATTFENCQAVIAGIKSNVTSLETRITQLNIDIATAKSEITNREEQVSRLKQQLLDMDAANKVGITELKATITNYISDYGQLQGKLTAKQGEVDAAYKQIGALKNQIAALESGQEDMSLIKKFIALLKKLFTQS